MPAQHDAELDRFLLSRLPDLRGARVLDVGCGRGAIGYLLRQHAGGQDAVLVGLDVHQPYLDFCARFNLYDELILGDIADLSLDGDFDLVVATEVLEHIARPGADRVLERLERIAKDRIIVTTPNGSDLRPEIDGVESEAHLSVWTVSDFRKRGYEVRGIGNRWHRHGRSRLAFASWYVATPLALRFPAIAGTIIASKSLR